MGVSTGCPVTVGEVMKRVRLHVFCRIFCPMLLLAYPALTAPQIGLRSVGHFLMWAGRACWVVQVDNKGWVHIGADLALMVSAVDTLFDSVRTHIAPVNPKPRL
jgi:hypothetical protein